MKKLLLMFVMAFVGLVAYAQNPIVSITTEVANQKSSVGSYTATWTLGAPESSETWSVANFNNNNSSETWNCMRCGRKTDASVATITTDFAINAAVNKVVVNMIPYIKTADKNHLQALKLEISSTNDFTAPETTISAENFMTDAQNTAEDVTFTIPAPAANKYYRLVFDCLPSNTDGNKSTSNGFVQVNSISYYGEASPDAGPAMPIIKMAAGNMVEISAVDGAQIYYTTDGEEPTAQSNLYTEPFSISSATQIKAIAIVDGKASLPATFAAYINTVNSINALLDLNDLTHTLTLEAPLTIVYHNGSYMYVSQEGAFLLLYGVNSDKTYANGDQLASATGIYTLYKDVIPELKDVQLGEVTEGGTPIESATIGISDINAYGNVLMNYFVKIEGVTIDLANSKLIQDGNELTYYNQFKLTLPEATEGKTYNVEGFISSHNGATQINIINVTEVVTEQPENPGFEYTIPGGAQETASGHQTYVEAITTTGAASDLNASYSGEPSSIYTLVENTADVYPGSEFTLNLVGHSLGDYSETTVHQDLRFTCAYLWADWYGNGQWEKISDHGNLPPSHYRGGNMDVLNITETLTMPADVPVGTKARIRVIYANAWTVPGATSKDSSQGKDAADPNTQFIEGGLAYDIVLNAVETPATTYAITIADTENGSIKVMNGEEEITSGTEVEEGTTLTIVATPAENYSLEAITLNDAALAAGEDGSYSFIVDEAYTVAATFAINKYAVTITEPQNGTLVVMNGEETVATGTELAHGTELSIIATPADGYELGAITVNGNAIEGNTLTLTEAATIAATFNEAAPQYETYPADRNSSHNARYTSAIVLTANGESQTISNLQTGTGQAIYQDATDQIATFEAGTEVAVKANYNGEWMHGYLWIDYNKDYQFTAELNDEVLPTATSELVGFTSYTNVPGESSGWHDSNGNTYSNGAHNPNNEFTFVLPANLRGGTYRARYIVDWNSIEPCPSSNRTNNTLEGNGGIVADFTISIPLKNYAITIADTENGSIKVMNGEEEITSGTEVVEGTTLTVVATPAENYSLEAITLNDAALAANEDGSYSFVVEEASTVGATFAINKYAVTITEPQNGTLVVMNGEEEVASGAELAHGTELSIIATPADGYELGAITVNGNAIEGNTLTLTEGATIAATFNEAAPEYETYPADRNSSHNARYTSAIVLTANGESQTISDLQTGTGQAIYQDATAQSATFAAGTEVSVKANYNGEWMHGYLWIDYNKDYQFTAELNDQLLPTATSELVGFTSYNDETGSLGWHDSNGNNYSDGAHNPNNPFTFVLPADLPAGNYRARYIVDWNSLEPLPSSDRTENTLEGNGGIVADFTITIPVSYCAVTIAETEATVEANVEDLTAIEKGTKVTFTVTVPEGKQLVSVAYNDEIITVNEDGTYTVTVNADGTLTVTLQNIPEPGKALLVPSANGSNIYTFRIDDAVLGSHTNGTVDENDLRSHNLTYSAWINIKNTTSGPIMGNIQSQFIDATGAFVVKLKDGKLTLEGRGNKSDTGYDNENPAASESTDPGTANDEWVFVSVVADREAKTVTLYKNCKAIASYNVENKLGLLPDESSFFIGGNGTSVEFTEVQLWNKALTPDELMDTYNFHYTETPENLAAYYKPSEFVEGSTTDLRNLGTVGTDVPGQLLMGTSSYSAAQWTYIYTGTPQEIVPIDEDRVLGTAAITLVQPVSEGNSLRLVNANGQAVGSEVTLFEKINVVPTLAEGIEVLGVVVESEGQTTTYSLDQFPIRATGDMTISLKLNDLYKVVATAENATVSVAVNDGEATELPAEGLEVAKGSKVVVTFTPAEGMVFKSFTVNGEDAELTENAYTIDAIDADYTLAAAYKEFTYKLTIINPADSDVPENNVYGEFYNNMMERYDYDDAEGLEVAPGTRVYLYISPAENHGSDEYYYFNGLTDNDQEVSVSDVMSSGNNAYLYPLNAIDADHTIVIKQALYTGIVGVVADAEGMISFSDYTIRVAADNAQIDIFDLNGRTLRSVAANEITVSDLVKGVYFAKATVNGKVYTLKFIKL